MHTSLPVSDAERREHLPGESASYFVSRSGNHLFCVAHSVVSDASPTVGVVFCHPLGEEKQNSYRPYVKLARRLVEHGVPSLRFDCFGFGDSEGDLSESTIESQVEDTLDAIEILASEMHVDSVVLFGVRLGGTIAALAADRDPRVVGLGLVSPIVDGAAYWKQLVGKRRMSLLASGQKPPTEDALWEELVATGVLEVGAQLIGVDFVRQLEAIDLTAAPRPFSGSLWLATVEGDKRGKADAERLVDAYPDVRGRTLWAEQERSFWSQQSMYDLYLPDGLFERVSEWVRGCS